MPPAKSSNTATLGVKSPKKSETIEIRISHATKAAFAIRCDRDAVTASQAIRGFIEKEIDPAPRRAPGVSHWRVVVAGVTGAVLGITAAGPSFARAGPDDIVAFERLDLNHDGVLSRHEFRAR